MTDGRERSELIDRREAVQRVALLLGGTLVGRSALLTGARRTAGSAVPQSADVALLDEIADTILPPTDSPGAKAARVGAFMALMVADCYDERDQLVFTEGLRRLEDRCRTMHGTGFMTATATQRTALLTALDAEQQEMMAKKSADDPAHYFRMMKELTLLGYFTSEIGATKALRWAPIPGRYDPCVDYRPGDRDWASPA